MYDCYMPLGDLMDAMALINSAINFILYCIMSRQFRKTFMVTFHTKWWMAKIDCCINCFKVNSLDTKIFTLCPFF